MIEDWYDAPAAPTVAIDSVDFSRENCCENIIPVINAGIEGSTDVPLSAREFILVGKGSGPATLMYSWTKIKGPAAQLIGANQVNLKVTNLAEGDYAFRLTVLHAESGVFDNAEIGVRVYVEDK